MATADILQTILHHHLATDSGTVANLPSVISSLSSADLEASQHLAKWTDRINSLIHAREPGARWAGIVLALHTSRLSHNILVRSAQGWVSAILPMFSRNESPAVWKATIRLLAFIFMTTINLAEFQRHVVVPNVPKFSTALLTLAQKQTDEEVRVLSVDTLAAIILLYPTLHRQVAPALSTLSLSFLNGSPNSTSMRIASSASRLHACLHTTGGKVGGPALWRKSVDETVEFAYAALASLRTTYVPEEKYVPPRSDPLISVALNLDRLRCGVELLCHLLRTKVERPIILPVRSLVNLCVDVLSVWKDDALPNDCDPSLRNMESAAVTSVISLGCRLADALARSLQGRLAPHLTRIMAVVVYHLEHRTQQDSLPFVKLLPSLLGSSLQPHDLLICGRMIKSLLPFLSTLLSQRVVDESIASTGAGSKRGKKRARAYEGEEVFNVGRSILCETTEDAELVVSSLDALPYILRVPNIPTYLHCLSSRLLLSILLVFPKLPPSSVCPDPTIKESILRKVRDACVELASCSSAVLSQSLPFVIDTIANGEESLENILSESNRHSSLLLDLMIHPRLPPLLQPLPQLDATALWKSEEGAEERRTREALGLYTADEGNKRICPNSEAPQSNLDERAEDSEQAMKTESGSKAENVAIAAPATAPLVIPAAPLRPAATVVIQPVLPVATTPNVAQDTLAEPKTSPPETRMTDRELDQTIVPRREEPEISLATVPQQVPSQAEEGRPSRTSEPIPMNVYHEESDEDMEVPALDPASPSDSEIE